MSNEIKAYKAFDKGLVCRGHKFEVGKEYSVSGKIKACQNGFHACENPWDVLRSYDILSDFAEVTLSGDVDREDDKVCARTIKVDANIGISGWVKASVSFALNEWVKISDNRDSGNFAQLASSGDYAQLASSGNFAQLASSGDYAQLASSGNFAKLASSGYSAQLASSGDSAQLASSGYSAQLASSGYSAQAEILGQHSVTANIGVNSMVKGVKGTLVCLCHYVDEKPNKLVTGRIGWGGLKADVWYTLDANGKFEEVR